MFCKFRSLFTLSCAIALLAPNCLAQTAGYSPKPLIDETVVFENSNGTIAVEAESQKGTTTLFKGDDLRTIGGRGTDHSYGSAWANLGNTRFRMYKHFTHGGGISTPFIAPWPKGIGKQKNWVNDPAHLMDVLPTLIAITGAQYPATLNGHQIIPMDGTSLLPAMRGGALPTRTIGFDHQDAHALRQGDWKAVYSKRMPHDLKWELYNLADCPASQCEPLQPILCQTSPASCRKSNREIRRQRTNCCLFSARSCESWLMSDWFGKNQVRRSKRPRWCMMSISL